MPEIDEMHATEARRLASLNNKFNESIFDTELQKVIKKAFDKIRREASVGKRDTFISIPRKSLNPDKMASKVRQALTQKNYAVAVNSSQSTKAAYEIRISW